MTPVAWDGMRGWLTLPAPHLPLREALVFLGAHGTEDMCSRHSLACLAQTLSEKGHPVLRVDLPGTGDALGDLLAPDLWITWVAGAASAVAQLRTWSGATRVGLMGLRLGALVAVQAAKLAATQGTPVHSLALLAPVLQGRQHLRELRALSDGGETLTVSGLTWGEPLQQGMAAIDLSKPVVPPPVQRVFLGVAHTNKAMQAVQAGWSAALPLTTAPYGDLVAHIGHTTHSQAPLALWQALGDWLGDAPAAHPAVAARPDNASPGQPGSTLPTDHGQEEGWQIPSAVPLAGVLSVPNACAPSTPVVVLCNTGRNPHTGWARSWVHLARQLAADGIPSLRFDIAGVGDSPPLPHPPQELLYNDVSLPQIGDAITWLLERLGPRPVVLVGNCSGGYLAFHHAKADPRVTHLLLTNVQRFVWEPGMSLEVALRSATKSSDAYARLLLQPDTWRRLVGGQIDLRPIAAKFWRKALRPLTPTWNGVRRFTGGPAGAQPLSPQQAVRRGFEAMSQRGTQVCVLYSEDDGGRDEFAAYFGARGQGFTRLAGTQLHWVPNADHEFTSAHAQATLLKALRGLCAT